MKPEYAQRFDEFQKLAVDCIVTDYDAEPAGRFLLVVPTGGGKTITAVKSVNALFERGVYDSATKRVLWVAHRDYLLDQAEASFKSYEKWYPDRPSYADRVEYAMLSSAAAHLQSDDRISLVVIDEAHHAAASSYLPLFRKATVGVLGLTATPSRHDGQPLEFQRESYSIGFPDLVDRGIVLRPKVEKIETGQAFELAGFGESDLDELDNVERNKRIIEGLLANNERFRKVVVYVGSVNHAKSLHEAMKASALSDAYESISYITGSGNSRGLSREEFLSAEKQIAHTIVVNVDVLTEGYDDPAVNTVVMARPTNSKLVYMQAMGRAIRHDPANELKQAYVVEVVDELPNIRYRIDNRWLYADISDALEPAVEDFDYYSADELKETLQRIYDEMGVLDSERQFPTYDENDRYGLLLFKVYTGPGTHRHIPILITRDSRLLVNNFFNYLSERLPFFVNNNVNTHSVFRMVPISGIEILQDERVQRRVFEAMSNSVSNDDGTRSLSPWITYVAFHHRQAVDQLSDEINEFLEDMVNAGQIRETILASEYPAGAILTRFPLPLCSFIGKILHAGESKDLESAIVELRELRDSLGSTDHRLEVIQKLNRRRLPIETGLIDSLKTIVRDDIQYATPLD